MALLLGELWFLEAVIYEDDVELAIEAALLFFVTTWPSILLISFFSFFSNLHEASFCSSTRYIGSDLFHLRLECTCWEHAPHPCHTWLRLIKLCLVLALIWLGSLLWYLNVVISSIISSSLNSCLRYPVHSTPEFSWDQTLAQEQCHQDWNPLKDMYTLIDDSCNCSYQPHCKTLSFPEMHSQSLQNWGALDLFSGYSDNTVIWQITRDTHCMPKRWEPHFQGKPLSWIFLGGFTSFTNNVSSVSLSSAMRCDFQPAFQDDFLMHYEVSSRVSLADFLEFYLKSAGGQCVSL